MPLPINHLYQFGEFRLDVDQRVLLREGKPVPLTPKVFETLLILVANSGRILDKDELMRSLWPDTFVEEANLAFNIQRLRKSLCDDARNPHYIETIPRRGYRFIALVEEVFSDGPSQDSRMTEAIQPPAVQSQPAAGGTGGGTSGRDLPVNESVALRQLTNPAQGFARLQAADAASRVSSNKLIGLAAAMILLAGAVVVAILLNRSAGGANQNSLVVRNPSLALPFQIEKLTATGQSRNVAISPDGRYIAYSRVIEQKQSVWLRQLATKTNMELVPGSGRLFGLAFANNGEYLYFVRGDPPALYRISVVGGVPVKIVDRVEGNFSVSADDAQIVFIRKIITPDGQREHSLVIARADGSDERTLLVRAHPDDLDIPVWSADGQAIFCSYGNSEGGARTMSLIEVRVADGTRRDLLPDRFFRIAKLAWLPHNTGLIMSARKRLEDSNQLWLISYPDLEVKQITEGLPAFLDLSVAADSDKTVASQATRISDLWVASSRQPGSGKKITQAIDELCWTPDGQLVYASTASGSRDLWIMRQDGTEQRQLTVNAAMNGAPVVTPDSRYIVFTSNRSGGLHLWRMNSDGTNQIQLTTEATADNPTISPDGKWVLYNTTDDKRLWSVSIDGGTPERLTEYPANYPSVSPDGRMIACMERSEFKREFSILILPFGGGQPLKRIDFTGGGFSGDRIQWTPDGRSVLYATVLTGDRAIGPTVILRQSLKGGQPERLAEFDEGELFDFSYSPDGQYFAATRGEWQHDIVLISSLSR
jgi:Tol biopolymer transport system component/DNA-binding winged helix-turn-helix (wHTH) protein